MTLGTRLRALRAAKGLSLRQVQDACGVSTAALSRAERGSGTPDTATLLRLENFYGTSLGSGLSGTEPTDEQVAAYLTGLGYNLEQLRTEINELIDRLRDEAKAILASKEKT